MGRRAPLREPDMLTLSKQPTQAEKFRQGSGAPTSENLFDQELRWLTFLLCNVRSIAPFRQQFEKILPRHRGHSAEQEDELSLLLD